MTTTAFHKAFKLAKNDMRIIFRDKSLLLLAFVPFLILGVLKFGLPALIGFVEEVAEYELTMVTVLLVVMSLFPAFILSFIVMDEKESALLPVFNILPRNYAYLINLRLITSFLYGFLLAIMMLLILNAFTSFYETIGISVLIALCGPQVFLIIVSQAAQKVEAMTWMKGLNFVYMLPVASVFLYSPLMYLFGILPTFWLFSFAETSFFLYAIIGMVQCIIYIVLLKKYCASKLNLSVQGG